MVSTFPFNVPVTRRDVPEWRISISTRQRPACSPWIERPISQVAPAAKGSFEHSFSVTDAETVDDG